MFLKSLQLVNFRNYESQKVHFEKNRTVIVGENAQGKTNLLESICLLATLDSPRVLSEAEYIMWDKDKCSVSGIVEKANTVISELDIIIEQGQPKKLRINGVKKSSSKDFLGYLTVVSFSVNDLLLLRGTPKDRRKWIDTAICQLYPAYYSRLQAYKKIRQQKQALLKSFACHCVNLSSNQKSMLESWNLQLAVAGANIIYLRQKYLKEINDFTRNKSLEISGGNDLLTINYVNSIGLDFSPNVNNLISVEQISQCFLDILESRMDEEIFRGQLLFGPHRDDISFFINDKDAKTFASLGQQRTIVLSLKLSELDLIQQSIGEAPVLLLDDVLAELDLLRQKFLFKSIENISQTIVSTTDIRAFSDEWLDNITVLTVDKGKIIDG